jgi:very-short-patch-repair endonuclease
VAAVAPRAGGVAVPTRGALAPRMPKSELELILLNRLERARVPAPVVGLRFAPPRRWAFDLAWPRWWLAVEVEGGVFVQGRHVRGTGYAADCEKYAEALLRGWRVLRVTGQHIQSGQAVAGIIEALLPGPPRADGAG